MQKPTRTCLLIVFCLLSSVFCPPAYANNITTSNVTINTQSTANKTCVVQFDISWQNSWRNPMNYDAAWVFVKYSTDGGSTWAHATLKASGTNPSGFSGGSGTGVDIIVPSEKKEPSYNERPRARGQSPQPGSNWCGTGELMGSARIAQHP